MRGGDIFVRGQMNAETPANRFGARAAKQRGDEIVDSLLARFNEHGCFQTTVDHVLADVGIGKGTLYRHYESREDLFKAALHVGLDALRVRCESVWEAQGADSAVAFRATIAELVSLNRRREAVSPATLARLGCGCQWMSKSDPDDRNLESALVSLVQRCQSTRLVDAAADPSLIAAVIMALVNSEATINCFGGELLEESAASRNAACSGQTADVADRLVELIQRAFPAARDPVALLADA